MVNGDPHALTARAELAAFVDSTPVGCMVCDATSCRPVSLNREVRRIVEDVRAEVARGRPVRHAGRQLVFGRLFAYGAAPVSVPEFEALRVQLGGEDAFVCAADLMAVQGWDVGDSGLLGPALPPPASAPVEPEPAGVLTPSSAGEGGSGAGAGPADVMHAAQEYVDSTDRVCGYSYWRLCQERRSYLLGRFFMLADPRDLAVHVRAHEVVAGPADVARLWSDPALALDYGDGQVTGVDVEALAREAGAGAATLPRPRQSGGGRS